MGHVGLETKRLRAADQLEELYHPPPTVHAAPADFPLGREPFAEVLGDSAGLAKRVGDAASVRLRIARAPIAHAAGRVNSHDAVGSNADFAKRLGDPATFADRIEKLLAFV